MQSPRKPCIKIGFFEKIFAAGRPRRPGLVLAAMQEGFLLRVPLSLPRRGRKPYRLPRFRPGSRSAVGAKRKCLGCEDAVGTARIIMLGHNKADVTQIYAERDDRRAIAAAEKVG